MDPNSRTEEAGKLILPKDTFLQSTGIAGAVQGAEHTAVTQTHRASALTEIAFQWM